MHKQILSLFIGMFVVDGLCAQPLDTLIFRDVASRNWCRIYENDADSLKFLEIRKQFAQPDGMEKYVRSLKTHYADINELSNDLTHYCISQEEAVYCIFHWIAFNIRYDFKRLQFPVPKGRLFIHPGMTDVQREWAIFDFDYLNAVRTIKKRKGICQDYADLFKELCDKNGIICTEVEGYAKAGMSPGRAAWESRNTWFFNTNHVWNSVWLNGKWYMLDATWASGAGSKRGTKDNRSCDEYYYLTSPENLFTSHVPENLYWRKMKDYSVAKR